jgi:hypothetical protein
VCAYRVQFFGKSGRKVARLDCVRCIDFEFGKGIAERSDLSANVSELAPIVV